MFPHQTSEICKYDQACSKPLCSYKHSKSNSKEKENNETSEEVKDYKFDCAYCNFKSDCYDSFMDHINNNHLESDKEDA